MNIKPLDIVSMIGIIIVVSSSAISTYIAVKASKKQKAQQEKDAKTKKVEPTRAGLPHSDGDRRLGPVRSRLPVADRLHRAAPLPPHPRGTRFAAALARGGGRRLRDVPEGGGQRRGHGRRGLRRLGVLPGFIMINSSSAPL